MSAAVGLVNLDEYQRLQARVMSEEDLAKCIIGAAQRLGWHVKRDPPWRATGEKDDPRVGFPDLVMLRDGEMIVAELKGERGRLSKAQLDWLNQFALLAVAEPYQGHPIVGQISVCVWRPSDWLSGRVLELLQ